MKDSPKIKPAKRIFMIEKNQRVVVVEGFVYSPATDKRNLIRRLEASLYTLRLPDELDLDRNQFDLDEVIINPED